MWKKRLFWLGLLLVGLLVQAAPAAAYEEDTHFLITYVICRSVGFSAPEALTVAAVDQGMDDSPGTVANGGVGGVIPNIPEEWMWHALDKDGGMGPAGVIKRKEELFQIALNRPNTADKLMYLGVFFHYQQDTWAHRHHYDGEMHSYNGYTTYNTPFGHAKDLHQPDRPPFDPVCAILNLEDGIKYARTFLQQALGRQPNAFLASYSGQGGSLEANWPRDGKYFHQLAASGAPNSARKYLVDLIRAQIDAYSKSVDPTFGFRETSDEIAFNSARTALQNVCTAYAAQLGGDPITIPSQSDKVKQGFTGMTTARLQAAAPVVKNYVVRIKTGTASGAGTDANIKLVIHGSLHTSKAVTLNPLISGNAFENGDLDTVTLSGLEDLGTLTSITLTSDNSGLGPGWFLDWVEIVVDGKTTRFNYNNWIDSDHGLTRSINAK